MKKGYKICPFCGNEIKEGAIKCQYCKEFFNIEKEETVKSKVRKEEVKKKKKIDTNKLQEKRKEKILTYKEKRKDLGITIGERLFENSTNNYLLISIILFVAVIIACLDFAWGWAIFYLIVTCLFILAFRSKKNTYLDFHKNGISGHIQHSFFSLLPVFNDIDVKYKDIYSIELKRPWGGAILFIILGFYSASQRMGASKQIQIISLLLSFIVFILPIIIRRNHFCKMVIKLNNGSEIRTSTIRGSKKQVFKILEKELETLKVDNIHLNP